MKGRIKELGERLRGEVIDVRNYPETDRFGQHVKLIDEDTRMKRFQIVG